MVLETVIVGSAYRGVAALTALAGLIEGDKVELRLEPENKVDPGAVAVYRNGVHLGYIMKHVNPKIGNAIALEGPVTAEVTATAIMNGAEPARGGLPKILIRWGEDLAPTETQADHRAAE